VASKAATESSTLSLPARKVNMIREDVERDFRELCLKHGLRISILCFVDGAILHKIGNPAAFYEQLGMLKVLELSIIENWKRKTKQIRTTHKKNAKLKP